MALCRRSARLHQQALRNAAVELDRLSDKDRSAVMNALHAGCGAVLARWWVDAQRQPYQSGWLRRGFRAPTEPGLSVAGRARSLHQAVAILGPYDRDAEWLAIWAPHLEYAAGVFSQGFPQFVAGPASSMNR